MGIAVLLVLAIGSCTITGVISYQLGMAELPFDGSGSIDPK